MNRPPAAALALRLIPADSSREASAGELPRLTAAMARGEDAAWAEFNRVYGPVIFRHLLALTRGDDDLAKEALQHTYLRIAKHVRPCDAEPMFKGWLRTVARTALLDCWRRRRSFTDLLFRRQQEAPEPADANDDEQVMRALADALRRLGPEDQALLEAKYFSGLDVRTLADSLGLSPKAVESRLTRARAALRRELLSALRRHE